MQDQLEPKCQFGKRSFQDLRPQAEPGAERGKELNSYGELCYSDKAALLASSCLISA